MYYKHNPQRHYADCFFRTQGDGSTVFRVLVSSEENNTIEPSLCVPLCSCSLNKENCLGFIFDGMEKSELFPAVAEDGSLPRKTFSMGCADDKRFYLEARKIK